MNALAISNVGLWIVVLALLIVVFALTGRQVGVCNERSPGLAPDAQQRASPWRGRSHIFFFDVHT